MRLVKEKSKCNVAIIGLGVMGNIGTEYLVKMPDVNVVSGVDVSREAREKFKKRWNIAVAGNYRNVIYRSQIDLVYIATPNHNHREIAVASLDAGRSVLLEKPMATTPEDCRKILSAYRQTKNFLQVGFECRYSFIYQRIKELIDDGTIGEVRLCQSIYSPSLWPPWLKHLAHGWKWKPEGSGGMVGEKISHYIDLFSWFTGKRITEVYTLWPGKVIPYFKIMDNFHLNFRFQGGAVGEISFFFTRAAVWEENPDFPLIPRESDKRSIGMEFQMTLIGTRGSIFVDVLNRKLLVIGYGNKKKFMPEVICSEEYPAIPGLRFSHDNESELRDVVQRVRNGEPPGISPEDSFHIMQVCFAAERSGMTRRVEKVKT